MKKNSLLPVAFGGIAGRADGHGEEAGAAAESGNVGFAAGGGIKTKTPKSEHQKRAEWPISIPLFRVFDYFVDSFRSLI